MLFLILIYPPLAKPCEAPAGVARLSGALAGQGRPPTVLDASVEGIFHLLRGPMRAADTWTARAMAHLPSHIEFLRRPGGYEHADRYRRAVGDLNRVLQKSVTEASVRLSLGNYSDQRLSPVRSGDLIRAAGRPEANAFYGFFRNRLTNMVLETGARTVGFSVNYLSQALCAFSMLGFLRKEHPDLKVVLGGGLVTSWMRRPGWKNPFGGLVDHMVAGPGEQALLAMQGLKTTPGVDLPDYDGLPVTEYFAPGFILPYSASTGCYWGRCSFCPEVAEGNRYKPIDPRTALEQVNHLAERTHPSLVHFLDNAMSPALLEEIARSPLERPWYGFVRITPHLALPDFCRALKRSGCVMLKLGLESGDQEVLDRLQKGIDLDLAARALKALSDAGIGTYVYLLFGTPVETPEKARKTLAFTVRQSAYIDFLSLAIFNMPHYGQDAARYGTSPFYEGDLSLYTCFEHPSGWNRPLVRAFLEKEFKKHPAVAAILRREPPFFTSNHAPFFVNRAKRG